MKQQLAELIEAYAASRVTGNRNLIEFASGQLSQFLQAVEVTAIKQEEPAKVEESKD